MISIVEPNRYSRLKELHKARVEHHPLINAILSGIQTGYVYSDPGDTILFVGSKAGFCLLCAPDATSSSFAGEFWHFLQGNEELPSYIHIYGPPHPVQLQVVAWSEQYKIRRRVQFHRHGSSPTYEYEALLPHGYGIATIQAIGCNRLEGVFPLRFSQRYWDSKQDFMTRAIGVGVVDEQGEPRAVCYSAAVVDGLAEMDTFVLPESRGRRLMRIVSEPFFNLAMDRKLIPQWDTFIENVPSYLLAQKFNLSPMREYDLLSLLRR